MTTPIVRGVRVAAVALAIVASPSLMLAQPTAGSIRGTVRDSMGGAIVGATISVDGSTISTRSSNAGAFRLDAVPAGRLKLAVRRLGFAAKVMEVDVAPAVELRLAILLSPIPQQLEVVEVSEHRTSSDERLAGYNARRQRKVGYFVTRERIETANSRRLTDMLAEIPGVRFFSERGGPNRALRLRGARCPPLVFLDGSPATSGEFDLDNIDPATVEGIEVYPDMMSVPPELLGPRDLDRCGVIAVWSRPFRPRPRISAREEVDPAQLVAQNAAFVTGDVDVPARLQAGTGLPVYPESLWVAGLGGRAMLEFIVDTTGSIVEETIRTVSTTHPLFAAAAREALATAQFVPAMRRGRRVAQLVQLPVVFTVSAAARSRPM
jgi:TonB family protein